MLFGKAGDDAMCYKIPQIKIVNRYQPKSTDVNGSFLIQLLLVSDLHAKVNTSLKLLGKK